MHNEGYSKRDTFLISFFVGWTGKCNLYIFNFSAVKERYWVYTFLIIFFWTWSISGADWFYLSEGTPVYIVGGVFKLITIGGGCKL